MPEKTAYAPGEPIWVDLSTSDQAASAAFYGALLGWTATEPAPDMGGYASFELAGRKVAGLAPLMAPGQPVTWTCYVCSDDADKTAALVEQAGGGTLVAPMGVADLGRMAVFTDPEGAVVGVWEPGTHTGAELAGEPGTCTWVELTATAPARSTPFYETVFGWQPRVSEAYVELLLGGTPVAGVTDPVQGTSGWTPYFEVADPGAAAERAQELGGTVVLPLTTFDGGSCTIVRDPQGAVFGLLHGTGGQP
jgi:predicted enzyme related to lactoylglutathione lyase